jgi:hypothetical protein
METDHSMNATNSLEKIRRYTIMLRGVCESAPVRNRNSPIMSEKIREVDVGLNLRGGMGMYHKIAHIIRNRNRFKCVSQLFLLFGLDI